jgi:AcrR family transcriptional regulator
MSDDASAVLARLWRRRTPSRLGRPAELDVDQVVRAGVDLADRAGLAGVTFANVAKELGVTSMALYRHVGSKSDLLVLMQDVATGPPPDLPAGDWRAGLRTWAVSLRLAYVRRPWLATVPVHAPPMGPGQVAWMEAGLRAMRDTGLAAAEKLGVLGLLSGYVRQMSVLAAELAAGRDTGQREAEQAYGAAMVELIDADRFPEVAALFTAGPFDAIPPGAYDDPAEDPDFLFGLDRILDGIAAMPAG